MRLLLKEYAEAVEGALLEANQALLDAEACIKELSRRLADRTAELNCALAYIEAGAALDRAKNG